MNIRQLQYLCSVMRFGSFSRAAQDQGVSVQAVSKAIVELEGEFGQRLFVRGSKGVSATPFGRAVSLRAQHAVDAFRAVEEVAATGGEGLAAEDDVLRTMLVTPPFPHKERVCGSFAKMFAARMGIDVDLQVGADCDALTRLLDGSLDAFFTVGRFEHPECESFCVGTLPAGIFLCETHPLAGRDALTFEDLAPYPVGVTKGIDDFNETVVNLYRKEGLPSKPRVLSSVEEVRELLEERQGYIMGVGIRAFETSPIAVMHLLDPACAIPVQVCMVVPKDCKSEKCRAFEGFMRSGFFSVSKAFSLQ